MRILMVHNRYQAAGGEDASTDAQIALLRDSGHEVVLLGDTNERIAELGTLRTAARSMWSREAKANVSDILHDGNFDVMHVQNYFPLFSPSIYYAARDQGVPVVQSLRNFRALCPEGMLYRDGDVCTDCVGKRIAWPGIMHKCYRDSASGTAVVSLMSAGHRAIGTWQSRVNRYVTPSMHARDVYVQGGWDPDLITVIPNFVYPDPGLGDGKRDYAVYAGRLFPAKGLDTLLAAWDRGGIEVTLKIVGEGPLKHIVRDAVGRNPNIEFLGQVTPEEVSELVGDAMFSVMPTQGIETFGRVAAESLARGTPSIAADHGGLAEIVLDGKTGLLFPPGDVTALIAAVKSLITDPGRLARMREAARADFLDRFVGDRVLARWVDLYQDVISGR
jgi:glycosyltransferase involved in cell wall biosynthesis